MYISYCISCVIYLEDSIIFNILSKEFLYSIKTVSYIIKSTIFFVRPIYF